MALEKLRRGDIVAIAGAGYSGKPRPAVVIQSDLFPETPSLTVCLFTGSPTEASEVRVAVAPTATNNLKKASMLMVDKVATIRRTQVGQYIGRLSAEEMGRLNRALLVFLGLAGE